MEPKIYYTAPSDDSFKDMKEAAIQVWQQYKDESPYWGDKTGTVERLENIKDNFMYIFSMFDHPNQMKCIQLLKEETKAALKERMIDGGNDPWHIQMLGL